MKRVLVVALIIILISIIGNCFYQESNYSKKMINAIHEENYTKLEKLIARNGEKNINKSLYNGLLAYLPLIDDNHTPLTYAICSKDKVAVEMLINNGADPNAHFVYMPSPLECAVAYSNLCEDTYNIINLLVQSGVDVDSKSADGKTALLLLAESSPKAGTEDYSDVILKAYTLIKSHANNKNPSDDLGNTVLHYAVEFRNVELVRYLLEDENIDAHAKNNEGKDALENSKDYTTDEPWEREAYKEIEALLTSDSLND